MTGNISLLQAVLCGVIYWLAAGNLPFIGFWTLAKPLVCGTMVGCVLGDPIQGAVIGAWINLLYPGFVSAGGSMPADISLAGILGTVYFICGGLDKNLILILAVFISLAGKLVWQARLTVNGTFLKWADQYIEEGKFHKLWISNVVLPEMFCAVITIIPCMLAAYYGCRLVPGLIQMIPGAGKEMLETIGGFLPCVAIAGLLVNSLNKESGVFLAGGFLAAFLTSVPVYALSLCALPVALACKGIRKERLQSNSDNTREAGTVGNKQEKRTDRLISRKNLFAAWLIWETFPQTCYNYKRMMGQHMAMMFLPLLDNLYGKDREQKKNLMRRESEYFNTHIESGACVPGMTIAMEEKLAMGGPENEEHIRTYRNNFMGAAATPGDSLWQGMIIPVLLGISIDLTLSGTGTAYVTLLYVIIVTATAVLVSWKGFLKGYQFGPEGVLELIENRIIPRAAQLLSLTECVLMGGLMARYGLG